jgi:hypothetical protein
MKRPTVIEAPVFVEEDVRCELDRILSSPEFRNAERLTRLLRHVVERTLEGAADRLKESLLGIEVFDRNDFDPRIDPIVRVEASRLRKRLEDFYRRSGCPSGIAIALPKGTYAASFERPARGDARESVLSTMPGRRLAVAPLGSACAGVANEVIHQALRSAAFDVAPWTVPAATEPQALQAAANSGSTSWYACSSTRATNTGAYSCGPRMCGAIPIWRRSAWHRPSTRQLLAS